MYVGPVRSAAAPGAAAAAGTWQISDQGGTGMAFWRRDGKELYYLAADRGVMAVEVGAATAPSSASPVLFRPSADIAPGRARARRASAATASGS